METAPRGPHNRGNCCGLLPAAKRLRKIVKKVFFAVYNPISLGRHYFIFKLKAFIKLMIKSISEMSS